MDFIATAPLSTLPPDEGIVTSDRWFPDIDLSQIRAVMRLDGTVTAIRLKTAVQGAVIQVNQELHAWQQAQQEAGYPSLASIPASIIDGQSVWVWYYVRAVAHLCLAQLQLQYLDFTSTQSGERHAQGLEKQIDEARRVARSAICALLQKNAITTELI